MRLADKTKTDAAGKTRQSSFVIRLISFVLLTLSLTTSTLAWIGLNADDQSNRMNMNVDYDRFYVEASYYKYNPKEQVVESSASLIDIDFNQYDLVFRGRNRYTPIIAAIKITGEDLPKDSGTITIQINRDSSISGSYVGSDGVLRMAEKFSTIMRVTAMVGAGYYSSNSTTLFNNIDTNTNYNDIRALTGDHQLSKVFTTVTTSSATPSSSTIELTSVTSHDISIDIDYTSSDFVDVDGDSERESLFVYLYITYDEGYNGSSRTYNGLLGIYQRTSDTMGISAGGDIKDTSVLFENDLISIKVSHSQS